ncbi:MAG: hypothetical protein GY745_02210, partial [Actinomycetia bacterium]|nr:hypothetical protein [Actinomycetes bacterium]
MGLSPVSPRSSTSSLSAARDVQLDPGSGQYDIDDPIRAMPLVVDAIHLTGRFDYQPRVASTGMG